VQRPRTQGWKVIRLDAGDVNDIPLFASAGLVLAQALGEYLAMLRTGTLRRKHKREWTYHAVVVPFKVMVAATLVEHLARHTRPTTAMVVAGSLFGALGIILRVRGHLALEGAFSQYVELSENQRLAQSGLYATIRHPMYVGTILLSIGTPLVLAATWAWIFSALTLLGLLVRIRKEEAFLARQLPGYQEYMRRTWRLVPYLY
jgi:protein-S-isoprenylcysteine O-methyltransferase Ste14